MTQAGRKLEKFAFLHNQAFEEKLDMLAQKAEEENWQYEDITGSTVNNIIGTFETNYPILRNYLNYTFKRVDEENKVIYDTGDEKTAKYACFNTGLISTNLSKPIFGLFEVHENYKNNERLIKWHLFGFFDRSQVEFTRKFAVLPKLARYVDFSNSEDFSNYVYNPDLELDIADENQIKHIISRDNISRFPQEFQELPGNYRLRILNDAIRRAKELAEQSNRIALPQWRPNQRQLQILLPLFLDSGNEDEASVALPIQTQGNVYAVKTVLPLSWAYSNARLLSRFRRDWLKPIKAESMKNEEDIDSEN
ncbi:MAG: DUF3825 domain-containing protein [Nostoc sp.]|uniref:DUF3825 domain-containing protein n=1 Tax=Nostoc sp. TaxID=1180 RepID=UPI002FF49F58